jgi:excinuclease ABC subunit C
MLESLLDEIPALGESRRRSILEQFGSITALRKASREDIAKVPGIGEKTAAVIVQTLAGQTDLHKDAIGAVDMATGEILDS